ncbi:MAG: aminodeoxychorismate/anthranilate synthase component II [Bacteroidia bacterium]|nr:aminodeoxychorismate/anthranilate synthase component II [Bacteroidia bacterium]MDW8014577.1 aminodeoxychorismate/anthranilate synthase component II [Bacteroidia bacterium]
MRRHEKPHILLIDNYDSFTFNIVALLELAGAEVTLRPADDIMPAEIYHYPWEGIVVGPGPGHPAYLSEVLPSLLRPAPVAPLLGICLGHQYLIHIFGGKVEPMGRPLFGIQRLIHHTGEGLFQGQPDPLPVGLYHALHASYVPEPLRVVAWDDEGHCMAIMHPTYPIWGVQFHPDSILTPGGPLLIESWVRSLTPSPAKNV